MEPTKLFFLIIGLLRYCATQDYSLIIDDIPIENFDHGDHQENEMDLELLSRRQTRYFSWGDDPKEHFFGSKRSFEDKNLPRPIFQAKHHFEDRRRKRNAADPIFTTIKETKSLSGLLKNIGKPLEVIPLDTKNLTEKEDKADGRSLDDQKENEGFVINDFIRFKRSPENFNSEKIIMEPSDDEQSNREARGATKEQWVKQTYPIKRNDEMALDDNIPYSSETVRAPRVHFVTQKFSDSGPAPSELRPYGRETRARNLDRESSPRDHRDIGRETQFYERRFRPDGPPMERGRPYFRNEMYLGSDPREARHFYRPRVNDYDRIGNDYPVSIQKPQKRIIYYATLPEISRTPPNVDLRDRYRYSRDRYDDRYENDPYRFRKTYQKSRYAEEGKPPYPVKVLTDVNVREVKKNPERRIYSEVDRNRYAYNSPSYPATDG